MECDTNLMAVIYVSAHPSTSMKSSAERLTWPFRHLKRASNRGKKGVLHIKCTERFMGRGGDDLGAAAHRIVCFV